MKRIQIYHELLEHQKFQSDTMASMLICKVFYFPFLKARQFVKMLAVVENVWLKNNTVLNKAKG